MLYIPLENGHWQTTLMSILPPFHSHTQRERETTHSVVCMNWYECVCVWVSSVSSKYRTHFNVNWPWQNKQNKPLQQEDEEMRQSAHLNAIRSVVLLNGLLAVAFQLFVTYRPLEFYPNWSQAIWRCDIRKSDNKHLHSTTQSTTTQSTIEGFTLTVNPKSDR